MPVFNVRVVDLESGRRWLVDMKQLVEKWGWVAQGSRVGGKERLGQSLGAFRPIFKHLPDTKLEYHLNAPKLCANLPLPLTPDP